MSSSLLHEKLMDEAASQMHARELCTLNVCVTAQMVVRVSGHEGADEDEVRRLVEDELSRITRKGDTDALRHMMSEAEVTDVEWWEED